MIAEDAGKKILDEPLPMVEEMGYGYRADTKGIRRLSEEGIEFDDGSRLEAELKIIFPNWTAHDVVKDLPVTDDQGFVVTDLHMRNPDYSEVFAVGDAASVAASVTVPKLGSLGEMIGALKEKGIRVPDGFATTAEGYCQYLDANDLRDAIQAELDAMATGRCCPVCSWRPPSRQRAWGGRLRSGRRPDRSTSARGRPSST